VNQDCVLSNSAITCESASAVDLTAVLALNNHLHEAEPLLESDSRIQSVWSSILSDNRLHCFVAR
jgi:hypothetical protein